MQAFVIDRSGTPSWGEMHEDIYAELFPDEYEQLLLANWDKEDSHVLDIDKNFKRKGYILGYTDSRSVQLYGDQYPNDKQLAELKNIAAENRLELDIARSSLRYITAAEQDPIWDTAIKTPDGKIHTGRGFLIQQGDQDMQEPGQIGAIHNEIAMYLEGDYDDEDFGKMVDGYITKSGKFLNKKEAFEYAAAIKQMDKEKYQRLRGDDLGKAPEKIKTLDSMRFEDTRIAQKRDSSEGETYDFMGLRFDIGKAEALLQAHPREAQYIDPEKWAPKILSYVIHPDTNQPIKGRTPDDLKSYSINMGAGVNWDYAATTDITKPGIIATTTYGPMLIDGNHRLAKAWQQGVKQFPVYLLSKEETLEIADTGTKRWLKREGQCVRLGEQDIKVVSLTTPEQKARGFQHYKEIPKTYGFLFPNSGRGAFHMHNVGAPLLMVALDKEHKVVGKEIRQPDTPGKVVANGSGIHILELHPMYDDWVEMGKRLGQNEQRKTDRR